MRTLLIDKRNEDASLGGRFFRARCAQPQDRTRIITVESGNKSGELDAQCAEFYRAAIRLLNENDIPFLLGGAYAVCVYTGLARHTKDVDLFIRRTDLDRALGMFAENGYRTENSFPHWLAKIYQHDHFVDLIFAAGNGLGIVDDSWFARARPAQLLGHEVKVMAPEEIIWMKAFIQERERYDGADIAHLLQSCAATLDWRYLCTRFDADWRVLLNFLILFGYIYPSDRQQIPGNLLRHLMGLVAEEQNMVSPDRICRGTLLSRAQFLPDVTDRGYRDARLYSRTAMTQKDVNRWTAAIEEENRTHVTDSCT